MTPIATFSQAAALRDGTPVTIRVMRPDDRERIVAAFNKLEPGTIYTRFFSYRKEIPASSFERIAAIDFVHLAGLVATIGAGADETVIGSATYVGIPAPRRREASPKWPSRSKRTTRGRAWRARCWRR